MQSPLIGTPPLTPLRQNWIVALDLGGSDLEKKGEKRNSVDSPAKTAPTPVAVKPFPVFFFFFVFVVESESA